MRERQHAEAALHHLSLHSWHSLRPPPAPAPCLHTPRAPPHPCLSLPCSDKWMARNCRETCSVCEAECADANLHCSAWAKAGECKAL